jgi:hypothetical protein
MSEQVLDLRQLADEWRDELEGIDDGAGVVDNINERYVPLCDQLGIEPTPSELDRYANDYEPTLIHEDYFTEYAQELAEDIGAIDPSASWPLTCIDWDAAADALKYDYTTVRFDGDDYLIRSV